ncbi:hypothetical protein BABINDRAFT_170836 [Babjeviella inositovora NRRL Y-12698]|uniref:Presequence protease, mitochondrial n=1 Tax=Babjeviella inositovora NRRL Y-12698 TaxID=984486 RepID=A0A1E3QU93_9ASCO|nr:uncharacterized protein BABINDRAFT_170836 [Babjeviella inositovora NRRL Y-12698]ODQ81246.1 hypothetical protein BABINDRAFT_170836 [Babjeviella inositovora NRRL Y-12698]
MRQYPVGSELHGYIINDVLPVPEFSLTAVDLTHVKSGAKHLHIDRRDKNNVFSVIFKTNPPDATGVPHILEHTTLCGSYKYPVHDPFFKMLNRSLSNFMNAMTGHDYTFYPFSTTNMKDYENLRDVYLSSVLEPLLKEEDFFQEGWRLENEDPQDAASALTFKGVVYNEMKGQVSNASYYYYIKFQEAVYPSLNNSGGDPTKITDLDYQDLVDFHRSNYHPSNARVYTYGDIPLPDQLKYLDRQFSTYGKRAAKNDIRQPLALTEDRSVELDGPVDPMAPLEQQRKTSLTWFCGAPTDVYETFCMRILGTLLMDGHASPFYQQLVESGYGTDFSVNAGFDSTTALSSFTVGLQGLSKENSDGLRAKVVAILQSVKQELVDTNGAVFDKRVQAILHLMELSKKDQKADFGMGLLYGIAPTWANDMHPFENLKFDKNVKKFKAEYARGGLFERLIDQYLIGKPTFTFSMKPSGKFKSDTIAEEKLRLAFKVAELNEEDKKVIYDRGLALLAKQNEVEDVSVLPTLTMKDIPTYGDYPAITTAGDVSQRITDTNGLTYFRGLKAIPHVPAELYEFLPLFTDCLTNLGTNTKSMSDLESDMQLYTGGLSASVSVRPDPYSISEPTLQFSVSGSALNGNVAKIFEIWSELLVDTNFRNVEKLTTLIKMMGSNNISSIAEAGHSYARNLAASELTPVKKIQDKLSGISQIQFIQKLNQWVDNGELETQVIPALERLQQLLVGSANMKFHLIHEQASSASNEKLLRDFVSKLPSDVAEGQMNELAKFAADFKAQQQLGVKTFVNLPFQVNYAAMCLPGVPYVHDDGSSLQVLSNMLTSKHLHKEIREKGGAYGAGASYGGADGVFGFYTYRDPNPYRSIDLFQASGAYAVQATEWDAAALQEAKLSIFQGIDAPTSVRNDGAIEFRDGITPEMRQERRERLLACLLDDVRGAAQKYLIDGGEKNVVIVGSKTDVVDDSWKVIDMAVKEG